jgi:hypothetical protein
MAFQTRAGYEPARKEDGMKLEKGQLRKIYQKPVTMEDYEGTALLVKKEERSDEDGLELWLVRFDPEEPTYPRWVSEKSEVDFPD